MKATVFVRRVDDLGRVVIPKEIKRTMRIREGDPVEFFIDKSSIIIRKFETEYTPSDDLRKILDKYGREIPSDIVKKINEIADFLE